jgi:putative NADH-flavin reductase
VRLCDDSSMRHNVSVKRLAILGASGATGQHVVAQALRHGHSVVAVVRRAGSFKPAAALREVVWADLADAATLTDAIREVDVVISALGGTEKGPTTVCTDAMRSLVPAMVGARVNRLIAVSAHGVLETRDRSLYSTAVWAGVAEKMKDKEAMEPLIVASGLDWTIVRPPTLKGGPATGRYVTGDQLPIRLWHAIGRADLGDFLVREAENADFVRRYPRIHR